MGVTGLWRLIEPAGKPVPVETLENKVLAVDISIWLHQMVKGFQDAKGAPLPNSHLIGLFQRLCKLLYFRIKPVFVFDGAFPDLKKETIAKRQDNKSKYNSESERIKRELAILLSKKTAIGSLLGKQISPKKSNKPPGQDDDLFKLPALPQREQESDSESEEEESSSDSVVDLHSIDVESEKFKNLPAKEKYDLLVELKDTRKMNSWGRLHELPKKSDNFSDFQLQRLLKRRKVQACLEETEKEIGERGMTLTDLESWLNEEGIDTKIETLPTKRIASNNTTRFLLINNVKQALADAKKKEAENQAGTSKTVEKSNLEDTVSKKDELEDDLEKAIKMSLECVGDANTSACTSKTDDSWTSYMSDTEYVTDSEEEDGFEPPDMSTAKAYIMQYSDFTDKAIEKMVSRSNKQKTNKKNTPSLSQIIDEINNEKSVIIDNVELSSSDDEDDILRSKNRADKNQNESSKVDKFTSKEIESLNENLDSTQMSVICVGNPNEDVVSLESSIEESPKPTTYNARSLKSSPEHLTNDETDSSDNDFEDVPEIETKPKTVVELTLMNVDKAPEDDIFADVFNNDINKSNTLQNKKVAKVTPINKSEMFVDEDDDELQRAIKMSMECVEEEEIIKEVIEPNRSSTQQTINKDSMKKTVDEPVKDVNHDKLPPSGDKADISKTQESLNIVRSTESKKDAPIESEPKQLVEKRKEPPKEPVSKETLNNMVDEIQIEEQNLMQEKGRLDRVGRNITEQMTNEAKELLRLFGIPYIVAPMEAEAQCAFLESIKLTDGTITDDSDIWLFGGQTVYKNFFNQKKHVLQFLAERIEKSFNLSREQLILLALLVGSDYTTGLSGVGPVTALEILASFPFNKKKLLNELSKQNRSTEMVTGLQEFKQWVRSGKRTDNTTLKKKLRNVSVTDDFPSVRVVQAYLDPNVEKSEDKFSWGGLDIGILRQYTRAKFGWSQHKLDEIIKPVLNRMVEKKTQKSVTDYFKKKLDQSLDLQLSKRVKAAVQRMGPELPIEEQKDSEIPSKKGKGSKRKTDSKAGPSKPKQKKTDVLKKDSDVLKDHSVKVITETEKPKTGIEITIPKTDRYQEIIPQREKDKHSLLQNKLKAIELFRKNKIDKKHKKFKKTPIQPKAEAELSESSDSN